MEALSVSVPDAAHLLGVSEPTVWRMIYDKQLSSVKLRGRRLITMASIREALGEGCGAGNSP